MGIRDPVWKNSDPGWKKVGSGIGDREKHPGFATLLGPLIRYEVFTVPIKLLLFRLPEFRRY
jgi:hypothetical protein